jgi:hypothetical protein
VQEYLILDMSATRSGGTGDLVRVGGDAPTRFAINFRGRTVVHGGERVDVSDELSPINSLLVDFDPTRLVFDPAIDGRCS